MDNLNPSEISEIIKGRIDSLETSTTESNEGTIVFLSDGIARVHGKKQERRLEGKQRLRVRWQS
jgi:F0F1-type ATP synthase alpha subunit